MKRVYIPRLGKTVDFPDEYTPEQMNLELGRMVNPPASSPSPTVPELGPSGEQLRLRDALAQERQASDAIRATEVDPNAHWGNAFRSMYEGGKGFFADQMRGTGELIDKFDGEGTGSIADFLKSGGEYGQSLYGRQKAAYDDPEIDFSKGIWQGGAGRTARGLIQESGPTVGMLAEAAAVGGPIAGLAKAGIKKGIITVPKVLTKLPTFLKRGLKIAPFAFGQRISEGIGEGGGTAKEADMRGRSADEIQDAVFDTVIGNMPLAALDVLQASTALAALPPPAQKALANVGRNFLGKLPMKVIRAVTAIGAASVQEGMEEAIQEEITNWALDEGFDPKVVWNPAYARAKHPESFNIGALSGIVMSGANISMEAVLERNIDKMSPAQQREIFRNWDPEEIRRTFEAHENKSEEKVLSGSDPQGGAVLKLANLEPLKDNEEVTDGVLEQYSQMSNEDLALEAAHALSAGEEDAPAVQAYRARLGGVEQSAQTRRQKKRDKQRRRRENQFGVDVVTEEGDLDAFQRRQFAEQPRDERRAVLAGAMALPQDDSMTTPEDPAAAIRGAQRRTDLVNLIARLRMAGKSSKKLEALARARYARLPDGGFGDTMDPAQQRQSTPSTMERFVLDEKGRPAPQQQSEGATSTQPAQPAEQLTKVDSTSEVGLLPDPAEEVQVWEESPLTEVAAESFQGSEVKPTKTGLRARYANGHTTDVVAVDLLAPDDASDAALAKWGLTREQLKQELLSGKRGMPALVKHQGNRSVIFVAKGFNEATHANKQSLDHEAFHVAMKYALTAAEKASVLAKHWRQALREAGISSKMTVRQALDNPTAVLAEGLSAQEMLNRAEEVAADTYGDWAPKQSKIIDKIWQWYQTLFNTPISKIGVERQRQQTYRDIRSGKAQPKTVQETGTEPVEEEAAQIKYTDEQLADAQRKAEADGADAFGQQYTRERANFERRRTMRYLGVAEKDLPGYYLETPKAQDRAQVREEPQEQPEPQARPETVEPPQEEQAQVRTEKGWLNKKATFDTTTIRDIPAQFKGRKVTVREVGEFFQEELLKRNGGKPLDLSNPAEYKKALAWLRREFRYQLERTDSGQGWYDKTTDKAIDTVSSALDLGIDTNEKRQIFKMVTAMTSLLTGVDTNFDAATRIWKDFQSTGKFSPRNPETGKQWTRFTHLEPMLNLLNYLIDSKGFEGAAKWLMADHTIEEIRTTKHLSKLFKSSGVPGKMTDRKPGALIFGEKVGPFFLNMNGVDTEFTADMWVSRTYNRLMGTLLSDESESGLQDAPRNESERAVMKRLWGDLASEFGVSLRDAQAIMWYYEQELYSALGAKATPRSYADAAEKIQAKAVAAGERASGQRSKADSRGQDAEPGAGESSPRKGKGQKGFVTQIDPVESAQIKRTLNAEAALKLDDGTIVKGPSHLAAYLNALADGVDDSKLLASTHGFVIDGEWFDRNEALRKIGAATSEEVDAINEGGAAQDAYVGEKRTMDLVRKRLGVNVPDSAQVRMPKSEALSQELETAKARVEALEDDYKEAQKALRKIAALDQKKVAHAAVQALFSDLTAAERYVEDTEKRYDAALKDKESGNDPEVAIGDVQTHDRYATFGRRIRGDRPSAAANYDSAQVRALPGQSITSEKTSRNQVPAVFKTVQEKLGGWKDGTRNWDVGGGSWDKFTSALREVGVHNILWDPYARNKEWNDKASKQIELYPADTGTSNNVLNVIKEQSQQVSHLYTLYDHIKPGGTAYISVYEGKKENRGQPQETRDGYQQNQPTEYYLPLVKQVFGDNNVKMQHGIIVARKANRPKGVTEEVSAQIRDDDFYKRHKDARSKWFGDAVTVDSNGEPVLLFRGGFHTFREFDLSKSDPDGYFGRGIYFTDNADDAYENYAKPTGADRRHRWNMMSEEMQEILEFADGDGQDMTGAIESIAADQGIDRERLDWDFIEAELEEKSFEDIASHIAHLTVFAEGARITPAHMALKNPFRMGAEIHSPDQTTFDMEIEFDGEDISGVSGTGADLLDAIYNVAEKFHGGDNATEYANETVEQFVEYLSDKLGVGIYDGDQITGRELYVALNDITNVMYMSENSMNPGDPKDYGAGEFVRNVLMELGFDGVIMDATVFSRRGGRGGMPHTDGTKHYIAWDNTKVKSPNAKDFAPATDMMAQVKGKPETETKKLRTFPLWFRKSKVVDEKKQPKVVYHGTALVNGVAFDVFDEQRQNQGVLGYGFYFAEDPRIADTFTKLRKNQGVPAKPVAGATYPAYLRVEHPFDYDKDYAAGDKEADEIIAAAEEILWHKNIISNREEFDQEEYNDARDAIKRGRFTGSDLRSYLGKENLNAFLRDLGYDGIVHKPTDFWGSTKDRAFGQAERDLPSEYYHEPQGRVWVAFEPKQIKSAYARSFDPETASISAQIRMQARAATGTATAGMTAQQAQQAALPTGIYDDTMDGWFSGKEHRQHYNSVEAWALQNELAEIVGEKNWRGRPKYGKKTRDIARAIHIHNDLLGDPAAYSQFYSQLNKEQKRIADIARDEIPNNPRLLEFAGKLDRLYREAGEDAKQRGLIYDLHDNYVNRVWRFKDKSASEATRSFGTTTRHRRERKLPTILQGWAEGLDLATEDAVDNLRVYKDELARTIEDKALIDRARRLRINSDPDAPFLITHYRPKDHNYQRVQHPNFKYWVPDGVDRKGEITSKPKGEDVTYGQDQIKFRKFAVHPPGSKRATKVFDSWDDAVKWIADTGKSDHEIHERIEKMRRVDLYAPAEMAKHLNNILAPGFESDAMRKLLKYNAVVKGWILITSFFHHQAFMRSFLFATPFSGKSKGIDEQGNEYEFSKFRVMKSYQEGMKLLLAHDEELQFLIDNGLTIGTLQDWEDSAFQGSSWLKKWIDEHGKVSKWLRDKAVELRQRQATFLFKRFGAALKAQAALIEYRHALEKYVVTGKATPQQAAKKVAQLLNDDFGGLNLSRMGVKKTNWQVARLLLLAPDWTGSNFLTLKRLIAALFNKESKKPIENEMTRGIYSRFWAGAIVQGLSLTLLLNIIMSMIGRAVDDDLEYPDTVKFALREDWTRLLWLDADVTPMYKLYLKAAKALGFKQADDGRRRFFSVFGHFKDPLRWTLDPPRSIVHKSSPIARFFTEAITGADWKGDGFTTVEELFGKDDRGYYKTDGPGYRRGDPKGGQLKGKLTSPRKEPGVIDIGMKNPMDSQLPSYLITMAQGNTPVQVQEVLAALEGQRSVFDAGARMLGLAMSPTRGSEYDVQAKELLEFRDELSALRLTDRKAFAEARRANPDKLRALTGLETTDKRIRVLKTKIIATERDKRKDEKQRKDLVEKYEQMIKQLEDRFMERYFGGGGDNG